MLKKLQKLMMLCLAFVGISMNASAIDLQSTLDFSTNQLGLETSTTFPGVKASAWTRADQNISRCNFDGLTFNGITLNGTWDCTIPTGQGYAVEGYMKNGSWNDPCLRYQTSGSVGSTAPFMFINTYNTVTFTAPEGYELESIKFHYFYNNSSSYYYNGFYNGRNAIWSDGGEYILKADGSEGIYTATTSLKSISVIGYSTTHPMWITSIDFVLVEAGGGGGGGATKYNVNVAKGITGGSISASPKSVEAGATVSLSASPNTGYEFTSWNVTSGGSPVDVVSNQFIMPAADVDVSATFTKINYNVNISGAIANGSVTASKTVANYGDVITLTPTAAPGFEFDSWNVTANGSPVTVTNNQFTMPANNVSVSANFVTAFDGVRIVFDTNNLGTTLATTNSTTSCNFDGAVSNGIVFNGSNNETSYYPTLRARGTYPHDYMYVYRDAQLSFTAPTGKAFKTIKLYYLKSNLYNYYYNGVQTAASEVAWNHGTSAFIGDANPTLCDACLWNNDGDKSINNVTMTVGSYRYALIWKIEFTFDDYVAGGGGGGGSTPGGETSEDITINPTIQYATYYNSAKAVRLPSGVEGYVFGPNQMTNKIELFKAYDGDDSDYSIVPAGEAVVLMGSGEITLNYVDSDPKMPDFTWAQQGMNILSGSDVMATTEVAPVWEGVYGLSHSQATTACKHYALSLDEGGHADKVGFYWMNSMGAAFTSDAHKAYLVIPAAGYAYLLSGLGGGAGALAPSRFLFKQGEATAIKSVESKANNRMMYNLNGQRVNASAKGIVIMNGKKVVK